jgi:hypothetical protein
MKKKTEQAVIYLCAVIPIVFVVGSLVAALFAEPGRVLENIAGVGIVSAVLAVSLLVAFWLDEDYTASLVLPWENGALGSALCITFMCAWAVWLLPIRFYQWCGDVKESFLEAVGW